MAAGSAMLAAMDLVYSNLLAICGCLFANRLFGRLRGAWPVVQMAAAVACATLLALAFSPALMALRLLGLGRLWDGSLGLLHVFASVVGETIVIVLVRRAASRARR